MSKFTVEIIEQKDYNIWNRFVSKSSHNVIFANSDWLQIIAKQFDWQVKIYGCFQHSELVGGTGLLVKNKWNIQYSSPREMLRPYQPMILKQFNYKRQAKVLSKNIQIIRSLTKRLQNDFNFIRLINVPTFTDIRPFLWQKWNAKVRYNYQLPLDSEKNIKARFRRNIRKQISKANRNEITITESDDLDEFFRLVRKSYQKHHNQFPIEKKQLVSIFQRLKKKNFVKLYYAIDGNTITSARIILVGDTIIHDWLAGSDPEYLSNGSTPLLIWHILKTYIQEYEYFDFGGATYLPSIIRFKNNFGGNLVPYYLVENYKPNFLKYLIDFYHLFNL